VKKSKGKELPLLRSNPRRLLARINAITPERVRNHLHISLCYRWGGSDKDRAVLCDGLDIRRHALTEFATPDEMRAALLAIGMPGWYADKVGETLRMFAGRDNTRVRRNDWRRKGDWVAGGKRGSRAKIYQAVEPYRVVKCGKTGAWLGSM
jgi:hypothetical protein